MELGPFLTSQREQARQMLAVFDDDSTDELSLAIASCAKAFIVEPSIVNCLAIIGLQLVLERAYNAGRVTDDWCRDMGGESAGQAMLRIAGASQGEPEIPPPKNTGPKPPFGHGKDPEHEYLGDQTEEWDDGR